VEVELYLFQDQIFQDLRIQLIIIRANQYIVGVNAQINVVIILK